VLAELKAEGKDFTVVVYPKAGHGLLDVPPTDARAMPTIVAWIRLLTRARRRRRLFTADRRGCRLRRRPLQDPLGSAPTQKS
jgi:hypothetical protein